MNVKRLVAVALFAVPTLALLSAASVVTTPPASAEPTTYAGSAVKLRCTPGVRYVGKTAQRDVETDQSLEVCFTLSADRSTLKDLKFAWVGRCVDSRIGYQGFETLSNLKQVGVRVVTKSSPNTKTGSFSVRWPDGTFTASFGATVATGTLRAQEIFDNPETGVSEQCPTSRVKWSASRG